jgi:hypothetical protein
VLSKDMRDGAVILKKPVEDGNGKKPKRLNV